MNVDTPDQGRLQPRGRRPDRRGHGHRGRGPAAQDRPRRRGHDVRDQAAHRAARPRPELHQVHPADPRHAAAGLEHAASENPQGSTQTMVNGQTLQRHRLAARRHRQPRRDPGHHRHQPDPRVDRREPRSPRRTTTPSSARRSPGVVSVQTKSGTNEFHGSAFEFRQTRRLQARNPFSQPDRDESAHGTRAAGDQEATSSAPRSAARSSRTSGSSSATTRARATPSAARKLLTVPTGARPDRRLERVRRQHLRPRDRRSEPARAVPRQHHPDAAGSRRRRSRS